MKTTLTKLLCACALLVPASALAADLGTRKPSPLPAITAFSWTGAYVGVDAGYSIGRSRLNLPAIATAVSNPAPSGFSVGAHAGYRYQLQNNVVLGAEVRAFGNFGTENAKQLGGFVNFGRTETRWGGDARASLGYAMGRFLPYLAGGLAISDMRRCVTITGDGACQAGTSVSFTRVGWTIGGGVAYAFTNNLIARVDYAYSDFGAKTNLEGFVGGVRVKLQTHAVRAGLSYKF